MPSCKLGRQTDHMRDQIVRYIWTTRMKRGDRLPPVAKFRETFGAGTVTIARALKALEQDGVVEIRDRVGAFVKDAKANGHTGWEIGLVLTRLANNPFVATLTHSLQTCLHDRGCHGVPFHRDQTVATPLRRHADDLDLFHGLSRHLDQRLLHGLVFTVEFAPDALRRLEEAGYRPCYVGVPNGMPRGVFIDFPHVLEDGLAWLFARGCRRPAVLLPHWPVESVVRPALERVLGPVLGNRPLDRYFPDVATPEATDAALARLFSLPAAQQPDGLFIADDLVANWSAPFLTERWRTGRAPPPVATLANRQISLRLPYPALRFEVDIEALARLAVEQTVGLLDAPGVEPGQVWYRPARLD